MQYQYVKAVGCEIIVTNNGSDFNEFSYQPIMVARGVATPTACPSFHYLSLNRTECREIVLSLQP